jgi:hydroxymethylpyrimidine/phosphomethylpyrimidine kinase
MVATSGDVLLAEDAIAAIMTELAPLATLLTPNLAEAAKLLDAQMAKTEAAAAVQARTLSTRLGCPVLVKGGHGPGDSVVDLLDDGSKLVRFARPRIATRHTHGTGCVLSAAVAALLARGMDLPDAVAGAKAFVWQGLQAGRNLGIGRGSGPVDCLFAIRDQALPIGSGGPQP